MDAREQARHILRMYETRELEEAITEALEQFEARGWGAAQEALGMLAQHQPGCPIKTSGECLCSEIMSPRV